MDSRTQQLLAGLRQRQPRDLQSLFPACDPAALGLLRRLLAFNPSRRIRPEDAMDSAYFDAIKAAGYVPRGNGGSGGCKTPDSSCTTSGLSSSTPSASQGVQMQQQQQQQLLYGDKEKVRESPLNLKYNVCTHPLSLCCAVLIPRSPSRSSCRS